MISEMIHTASLVHDDVIDQSDFRRGKPSVNVVWNHKKVSVCDFQCQRVYLYARRALAVRTIGTHVFTVSKRFALSETRHYIIFAVVIFFFLWNGLIGTLFPQLISYLFV